MSRATALPTSAPPVSALARYRLLAPSAGIRVSPLCLGAMNFGDAWKGYMGACDQKTTEDILDYFYEQGGELMKPWQPGGPRFPSKQLTCRAVHRQFH